MISGTNVAHEVWCGLLDLVVGADCVGCGTPGAGWCPICARSLLGPLHVVPWSVVGAPVIASAAYDGVVRKALLGHKDDGRLALVRPLGDALARSVIGVTDGVRLPVLLVPVPSSASAVRQRGHDHALRLARRAARALRRDGWTVGTSSLLRASRTVRDQVGLDVQQRRSNKHGAFVTRPAVNRWRGHQVVVVDDIVTTGASLAESVLRLRDAGVVVLGAATVAAVQRRGETGNLNRGIDALGPQIA